ncbi:hypothetical protein F2Q68_00043941 [Brassica cretica]|uniref:Uncharacterized protein n=1 Tax=Brassica cretica TaxID=69181 RepID=A0A8S9LK05_BRACR|nr:hypothetical protein F2Q68_00043941 [Brassica cretica]
MLKSLVSLGTQNPISAREDQRIVNFQCSLELQRGRWSLWLREGRLLGLKASSDLIFPFQISGSRRRRLTLKSSMILFRDSGQTLLILDDFRSFSRGSISVTSLSSPTPSQNLVTPEGPLSLQSAPYIPSRSSDMLSVEAYSPSLIAVLLLPNARLIRVE